MKTRRRIFALLTTLALLLFAFALSADEKRPVCDVTGDWQGTNHFTGISYTEDTQKKVPAQDVATVLHISSDGTVTGRIGGADLSECVITANRGWLGRRLHIKTDFIIRGKITGAVVPGSEGGTHPINAPFNLVDARISGSVFVVYPIEYPYPFLALRLSH